jgi:hypothetical protein
MKRDLRNSRIRSFGQWITNFYWSDVFQISDCASKFDKFVDIMSTMVDCYFPSKLTKIHYSDKPWMTPSLKFAIKKRQIAFRRHGKLLLLFNVMFEQLELSTSRWWKEIKSLGGLSFQDYWYQQLFSEEFENLSCIELAESYNNFLVGPTSHFQPRTTVRQASQ